jgi:flagellar protein FlbT
MKPIRQDAGDVIDSRVSSQDARRTRKRRMSILVLELRQGEMMIVNGAPIRFRTKTRIELTAKARFLFGKQIMSPDEAKSPARRIYFALQTAYIGSDDERPRGLDAARELVRDFKQATTSTLACEILDHAVHAAETDDCYQALKLVRRIIRHEDAVLEGISETTGKTAARPTSPHRDHYHAYDDRDGAPRLPDRSLTPQPA